MPVFVVHLGCDVPARGWLHRVFDCVPLKNLGDAVSTAMEPVDMHDVDVMEKDWILGDDASNGVNTPGLVHKAPVKARVCAAFFLNNRRYILLLVLLLSGVIAMLVGAAASVHAGYMVLTLFLFCGFNYLMVRCVLFEYNYTYWRQMKSGTLPAQTFTESDDL